MPNQQQARTPHTSLPHTRKPEPKPGRESVLAVVQILEFLLKMVGLLATLLGAFAWIAGSSYLDGFWSPIENAGPLSRPSLQDTALKGFVLPYIAWIKLVAYLVATGLVTLVLGIRLKKKSGSTQQGKIPTQFLSRFSYDKDFRGMTFVFLGTALYLFCLVYYLALWINSARDIGRQNFIATACAKQAGKTAPSSITLDNGKTVSGWLLDRSDKFLMLVDGGRVYTVAIGDKVRLMDTTALALDCK
ncbi:hypothetical protein [Chromobacterium sp. CV08]|uniref:hypothetical protein n=1 Tax=Chromobacterium sp. CV08 TaxID=3133274 RepID=UPI003DAA45A8